MAKIYAGRHTYTVNNLLDRYPTLRNKELYLIDVILHYREFSIIAYKGSPGYCYEIKVKAPDEYTAYIFLLDMGYYDIQIQ